MLSMGNIASIDRGVKYIGVAYWNERSDQVSPIGSLMNDESLFFNIGDLLIRYKIAKLIVGYPKQNKELQKSIDIFCEQVLFIDNEIKIQKVDEEYSSVEATAITGNQEKSAEEDTVAAMVILNNYLDKEKIKKK